MRLIITDVTEMHGGNYCVAGWDPQGQRMVRPLPNGGNWTAALLLQHAIAPGVQTDVTPMGQVANSVYPHRTEDTPIIAGSIQTVNGGEAYNWFGAAVPTTFPTISAAFGGHVAHNSIWNGNRQGIHIPVGTVVGSLGAVSLPRTAITFEEDFGKLKAILDDGSASYKLAVSSHAIKLAWRQGGLNAVQNALPASNVFHIHLGLARAFGDPPTKCYMMVNGIHG